MITTAIPLWVQPEKYFSAPPKKDKQKKPQKNAAFHVRYIQWLFQRRNDRLHQRKIIRTNVFIAAILHAKPVRDRSERMKT